MKIPDITLFGKAFHFSDEVQTAKQSPTKLPEKGTSFNFAKAFYFSALHEAVMESWHKFAESRKKIARSKDADHQAHQARHRELEEQRRRVENLQQELKREPAYFAIKRQAEKFNCSISAQSEINARLA
jgi:hypothetical protein